MDCQDCPHDQFRRKMKHLIHTLQSPDTAGLPVEIVERKGLGHPDTICDALAEAFSLALSRYYRDRFGAILHHNVDKVLLCAGHAEPTFGGGKKVEPIEIILAGRATCTVKGEKVPVESLGIEACSAWIRGNMRELEPGRDVRIRVRVQPGSEELVDTYLRAGEGGERLANDTSCGCGYAGLSELERITGAVERRLNSKAVKMEQPAIGEDVKVMAVRQDNAIHLTVAAAMVDRFLEDMNAYRHAVEAAATVALSEARSHTDCDVDVALNTADDPDSGSIYLTVTGTSAESGDDGEAGRGNRANGLITPYRPMTMESLAGKNPVTHVGKLYNLAAGLIAEDIVTRVPTITSAECRLVSQIGHPIHEPQIVDLGVRLGGTAGIEDVTPLIEPIVARHLGEIDDYADALLAGTLAFDRWPFRQPAARDK
jgi:S-adenosylmethionine synthetase